MPRKLQPILTWSSNTELLLLTLTLQPQTNFQAPTHYTTELHAWFLDQVRHTDPDLSAYLHNGQSEKAFAITPLSGNLQSKARSLHFSIDELYHWSIAALSKDICTWLQQWLSNPPQTIRLRHGTFTIQQWDIGLPATTYKDIWNNAEAEILHPELNTAQLSLTFTSPTSFRKRSNHLPLPVPENVFHSYLRRWNNFAHLEFEQDEFLDWVNECIVIVRHDIRSQKTQAGKQGSVTGFIGSVQFGLTPKAKAEPEYIQLVHALLACAPYFGTGHKVTFGLGQTQSGWNPQALLLPKLSPKPDRAMLDTFTNQLIHDRQVELKSFFFSRKKRQGGGRAAKAADQWATIIARQELGESLSAIAQALGLPYDTVKQYAKRARQELGHLDTPPKP